MTPKQFSDEMKNLSLKLEDSSCYVEDVHREADSLLCKLLKDLGYQDGAQLYERLQEKYPYNYIIVSE